MNKNKKDVAVPKKDKKGGTIVFLLVVAVLGTLGFKQFSKPQTFDLKLLENLSADVEYEVISVQENTELEKMDVVIETNEDTDHLYDLVEQFKEVIEKEEEKELNVGVYVYPEVEKSEVKEEMKAPETSYRDYIEVTERITVTTPLEMGNVKGEAGITGKWELHSPRETENYKTISFNFNEDLTEEELAEEVVFKQLKGIYNVLKKHNENWTEETTVTIESQIGDTTYSYVNQTPTKLLLTKETEVVVQKEVTK